jgi:biopolymer transport protein ExbD
MAFDLASNGKRLRPAMNVTPLVDVVLVLLIIFMVVTPMLSRNLWLNVPPKPDESSAPPPPDTLPPVVLSMARDGTTAINGEAVKREDLLPRLKQLIAARSDKVVFFDAQASAPYGEAVELMDQVKGEVAQIAVLAEPLPGP